MEFKILVKIFCEKGSHPCCSYGISIFHSKYCQFIENVSENCFWLVHGLTLLTQAAFLGCPNGQWNLPS